MATEAAQETWTIVGQAAVGLIVAASYVANHFKGRKRDRGRENEQDQLVEKIDARVERRLTTVREAVDKRFDTVEKSVAEVRSFCVGPDGKNGFRKDIADLRAGLGREIGELKEGVGKVAERVDGIEGRERDRLERELDATRLDRRVHDAPAR